MTIPPVLVIDTGPWARLAAAARQVRTAVFLDEQRIDPALEWDDDDAAALHAVAWRDGAPVGTARLLRHGAATARIGRMAVLQAHRGQGLGRALLEALLRAAQARGDSTVLLHAQVAAQAFYARAGFTAHGPVFWEAGIEHVEMSRHLERADALLQPPGLGVQ